MRADRPTTEALAQLDALRLAAYRARLCAWLDCTASTRHQRADAHYCSTAHRCRAWRRRRHLLAALATDRAAGQLTPDHRTSPRKAHP